MRARDVLAVALLLAPAVVEAQRPRIWTGPIGRGGLSGPQPRVVAEAQSMVYRRLNVSLEGYPLVTRFDAPGFQGPGDNSWTSFGTGTRIEYRFQRYMAATLDVTSSFLGGPVFNQSAELGTRLGPSRAEHDIIPFVDARGGYFYAMNGQGFDTFSPAAAFPGAARYSHGFGALAGGGIEFAATRRFSVTTAFMLGRSRMTAHEFRDGSIEAKRYTLTTRRYVAALRYNGVRLISPPGTR